MNLVKQVTKGICWRQYGYILVKQVYKGFLSRQSGLNLLKQVNKGIKDYKIKWFVRTFNPTNGFWIAHWTGSELFLIIRAIFESSGLDPDCVFRR